MDNPRARPKPRAVGDDDGNVLDLRVYLLIYFNLSEAMPPIIIEENEKINTDVYISEVLEPVNKWVKERFAPGTFVFQQNGAPAHTSKRTQDWLRAKFGEGGFRDKETWPPSSPDATPLNFWCCDAVEEM